MLASNAWHVANIALPRPFPPDFEWNGARDVFSSEPGSLGCRGPQLGALLRLVQGTGHPDNCIVCGDSGLLC